jgi:hypothetical protein
VIARPSPSSWATSFSLQQPPKSSSYGSTKELQNLLGLWDPINSSCISTIQHLFHRVQPMRSLIDIDEGYHRGASNLISDHSQPSHPVFSTCRLLVSSPSLKLRHLSTLQQKPNHRTTIVRRGPITSDFQPLDFYQNPELLSIAIIMDFHHDKIKDNLERVVMYF